MANVRNYEEYRAEVLDTLGATVEDLRNEPSFRAKVLETLGVEFTDEDTRNFERYRLKALEGLKNGGGGSSDFSTAEVTVNSSTSLMYQLELSHYYDYDNTGFIMPIVPSGNINPSIILNAVLYKGQAMCLLDSSGKSSPNISVSGNIQDAGPDTYIITGDCTITIS